MHSIGIVFQNFEVRYPYFGARYYNPNISIWLSVDPQSADYPAYSPYNYTLNNPIRLVDPDGKGVFPSGEKLREQGSKTVTNDAFKQDPTTKQTYCNKGLQNILNAAGDHALDGLNANQIGYKLRNEEGFAKEITPKEALKYANMGVTVIASYMVEGYDPKDNSKYGSGHVAVVAPSDELVPTGSGWKDKSEEYANGLVNLFNIGPENYHGEKNLKEAIGGRKSEQTGLYIMTKDIEAVESRNQDRTLSIIPPVL